MVLIGRVINNKYRIIEKIGEGSMSIVWLAEDIWKKENVAVKVLKKGVTSNRIEDVIRFRNEATTVSKLDVPGIVKIHEIGEIDKMHYIVMEYILGKSLLNLIEEGFIFCMADVVEIIFQICKALKYIHSLHIVHKDIKPGNIIVNFHKESKNRHWDVKIIDFGLAQVKEFNIKDPGEILGTLTYMAPEQSGIIKRNIDERSDIYSIGIIFYQLLAKELPFKANNINAVMHQHIAKVPEKLTKFVPDIPEILEKMVLKLLEKEPEKRYQSVGGLLSDLEKFKKGHMDFIPGIDDRVIKLNYRANLVDREEELRKLTVLFDKALHGEGSVCLIEGEAGRGKTRLVEEFRNYVLEKSGMFIDGKCFSGKNKVPYGPFKDALNVYLYYFRKNLEERKNEIKEKLKSEIGNLGGIIIKLNPMMEEILGTCPPLVELEQDRENKRFLMLAHQFFFSLGKIENVLVIMLDDLQWSDEGSLELLNELAKEISGYCVMIVGTFRDNEIPVGHGLVNFIRNAKNNQYPLTEIILKNFDIKKMNRFIANLLFDSEENSIEIANFILQKSKGNPFFATEILKQVIDEKAIIRKDGKWHIDYEILNKMEISSSIVDILIKKISLLDGKEINILSYAAVIGRKFDIELLFQLGDVYKEEVVRVVDRAVELQLLEEDSNERGKILFVHDRIKEAFYKNIGDERKEALHLKIASAIENMNVNDLEKVIFDLAHHYIEGEDKDKALEYAYPAGIKSKENYANEEAIKYFNIVIDILEEKGLQGQTLWIHCMENIGEVYLTIGKTNETIELFNHLLPFIKTKLEKVNTYTQISYAYFKQGDWKNCEAHARKGLKILGEKLPVQQWEIILTIMKEYIVKLFNTLLLNPHENQKAQPETEEAKKAVWLYYILSWSYSLSGNLQVVSTALRMLNFAKRKVGQSRELGLSYMVYGVFLAELSWFNRAFSYHQKALNLRKELNDERGIAQSSHSIGFYYKCKGEYRKSIEYFITSINIFKKIGDIGELIAGTSGLAGAYFYLADYKTAKALNEEYFEMCDKSKDTFGITYSYISDMMYYGETGDFETAEYYGIKAYKLAYEDKNLYTVCISSTMFGKLLLDKGEIRKSIKYLEKAKALFEKNRFLKEYTVPLYPYLAEAYLADFLNNKERLSGKNETRARATALAKIKQACHEALKKTVPWVTYHVCSLRVNARYHALTGEYGQAENLFLESIDLSSKLERKYEQALGFFEYGMFLEQMGKVEDSRKNLESSYNLFKEIGSTFYERKVAGLLGIVEETTSSIERFTKELKYNQRLSSILALTQDISSILDLDELLEKTISIAMEITGAQKGYLMIRDDKTGETRIRVRKHISGGTSDVDDFSTNIVNEVLRKGQAILTTNAMEDAKYRAYQSVVFNELKSILCIPIKYKNEITGICYLDNALSSSVFTEEDIEVLNAIMTQAAISMENAKLYKLAITDGLTDLLTIKHFEFLLQKELERAAKSRQFLSLIMLDIDHFKSFNDTYGHQAGDQILTSVAKIFKNNFRNRDIIARYGGDEYAIVLPSTNESGAVTAAEKLRQAVESLEISYRGQALKITISLGLATYPIHASTMESLIKAADDAMYCSKSNGRNKVTVCTNPEMEMQYETGFETGVQPPQIKN